MRGCSSAGRVLGWHSRGRGFEPHHLHQKKSMYGVWQDYGILTNKKIFDDISL